MYDRCRAWRSLLTRQVEGVLSPSERAMLDKHLRECSACDKTRAADEALQSVCIAPDARMAPRGARTFDDRIVATLRALPQRATPAAGWRERVRACSASLSFEFCMQLAGGALAAASVTAFILVSALNPAADSRPASAYELRSISVLERNEPPVPLESLFQSPAPRAAMLWAAPGRSVRRAPAARPGVSPRGPASGARHGTVMPRRHAGPAGGLLVG